MSMKKNSAHSRRLPPALGGVLCAALTGAAVWYDLTYNGGRLVYPMDSYAFRVSDMPALLAIALALALTLFLSEYLLYRYDHDAAAAMEKAQYNPSLKLAVDVSRAVGASIEEIFVFD